MGEVYRAVDSALGRAAAIKVLPDAFLHDPDRLARFEREARILASLNHPNIAQVFGLEKVGADGAQTLAFAMELIEGPALADRIALGPIPFDEVWPVARQVAEAVEAAHEQGVVHRDLKPANIKVRPDGTVKVLDFGLAKGAPEPSHVPGRTGTGQTIESPTITSPVMTRAGVIMGTAAYMSPEQARGRAVDRRADIWAFGCVLFEMLTGRRAFPGDDVSDLLVAIIRDEPDWRALPAGTPERVRTLLRRCLQKDPQKRLPHIGSARLELAEIADAPEPAGPTRTQGPRLVERLTWAAGGAVLAAGLVLTLGRATPPDGSRPTVRFQIGPPPGAFMAGGNGVPRFAVSADGMSIAYQVNIDGRLALWFRRLDDPTGRSLSGTESDTNTGVVHPFFSRDGRFLAFFDEPSRRLRRVDIATGAADVVTDVAGNQTGGSWNSTDTIIFSTMETGGVRAVPASGGAVVQVTHVDREAKEAGHLFPDFLADGRRFLYFVPFDEPLPSAIFVGSLDGSAPRRLVDSTAAARFAPPDRVLYVRGETLVSQRIDLDALALTGEPVVITPKVMRTLAGRGAFAAGGTGTLVYASGTVGALAEGVWVNRSGKELDMPALPMTANNMRVSSDGKVLAYFTQGDGTSVASSAELWIHDIERRLPTRLNTVSATFPMAMSPDGSRVLFRGTTGSLLLQHTSGAMAPTVALPGVAADQLSAHDWSSDGRFVLITQTRSGGRGLFVLPMDGSGQATPYLESAEAPFHAQFSPDGRWVAHSAGGGRSRQVHLQAFPDPARGRWTASPPGSGVPRWRRDGKELYYLDDAGWLSAVSVTTSERGVTVGKATQLFQMQTVGVQGYPYDVSPDGQRFIVVRPRANTNTALTVELPPKAR